MRCGPTANVAKALGVAANPPQAGLNCYLARRDRIAAWLKSELWPRGLCTNQAEEYFSRRRRAEIGIHHHITGAYLLPYAQESSWREDIRCVPPPCVRVVAVSGKSYSAAINPSNVSTTPRLQPDGASLHRVRHSKTSRVAAGCC
jgi:hypothetical protein